MRRPSIRRLPRSTLRRRRRSRRIIHRRHGRYRANVVVVVVVSLSAFAFAFAFAFASRRPFARSRTARRLSRPRLIPRFHRASVGHRRGLHRRLARARRRAPRFRRRRRRHADSPRRFDSFVASRLLAVVARSIATARATIDARVVARRRGATEATRADASARLCGESTASRFRRQIAPRRRARCPRARADARRRARRTRSSSRAIARSGCGARATNDATTTTTTMKASD